ncbi:MAG: hypothetical protein QW812_00510 [Thermoplasmataceae archaeon]
MNQEIIGIKNVGSAQRLAINLILLELLLLLIQFLIGMWMNLFAVFPTSRSAPFMFEIMGVMLSVPELMIHMMVGVIIGIVAIIIMITFLVKLDHFPLLLSGFAFASILAAGIGGLEFLFSGFVDNVFSFVMSIGFILAMIFYSLILYFVLYGRILNKQQ